MLTLANLTIENRVDRVSLMGDVELTKDQRGLLLARKLKVVIDATVLALEAEKESSPATVMTIAPTKLRNPFLKPFLNSKHLRRLHGCFCTRSPNLLDKKLRHSAQSSAGHSSRACC